MSDAKRLYERANTAAAEAIALRREGSAMARLREQDARTLRRLAGEWARLEGVTLPGPAA